MLFNGASIFINKRANSLAKTSCQSIPNIQIINNQSVKVFRLNVILETFCVFYKILYLPINKFSVCRDGYSWVEPVLSRG